MVQPNARIRSNSSRCGVGGPGPRTAVQRRAHSCFPSWNSFLPQELFLQTVFFSPFFGSLSSHFSQSRQILGTTGKCWTENRGDWNDPREAHNPIRALKDTLASSVCQVVGCFHPALSLRTRSWAEGWRRREHHQCMPSRWEPAIKQELGWELWTSIVDWRRKLDPQGGAQSKSLHPLAFADVWRGFTRAGHIFEEVSQNLEKGDRVERVRVTLMEVSETLVRKCGAL